MPLTAAGATIIGAGIQAAGSMAVSGMGKKKAYKYNTKLQQQQFEQNKALADYQNQINRQNADIEYQRNLEQWNRENAEYQRRWEQQRNEDLAQWNRQNQFNLEQWNRENAYNDPAAQVARMKAAGINPNSEFGVTAAGSVPGNQAPASGDIGVANSPQLNYSDAAGYPVQGGSGVSDSMPNPFSGLLDAVQGYFNYQQKQDMNDVLMNLYRSQIDKNVVDTQGKKFNVENLLPLDFKIKQTKSDANFLDFKFKQDTYEERFHALQLANNLLGSRIEQIDNNKELLGLKIDMQKIINKYAEPLNAANLEWIKTRSKYAYDDINKKVISMLVSGKDSAGHDLDPLQKQWLLATQGILPSFTNPLTWHLGVDYLQQNKMDDDTSLLDFVPVPEKWRRYFNKDKYGRHSGGGSF